MPRKKRQKPCAKTEKQPEQKTPQPECSKETTEPNLAQPGCSTEKKEVEEQPKV